MQEIDGRRTGDILLHTVLLQLLTSWWRHTSATRSKEVTMESLFRCRQPSFADSDGGLAAVPGGIALQRLSRGASTDGDDAHPARSSPKSQRGLQSTSICPGVHVVTDFCCDVTATDAVLDDHGLYRFDTVVFGRCQHQNARRFTYPRSPLIRHCRFV